MRVGMRLADQMTNDQLDEFERYFEAKDETGAFKWLETNFPNYRDIVKQEFDKLKLEVSQSASQILAAAQSSNQNISPTTMGTPTVNNSISLQQPISTSELASNNNVNSPLVPQNLNLNQPLYPDQQPPAGPPRA